MTLAGTGSEEGHAARRLERKAPHTIDPLVGLRNMPDQTRTSLVRYEDSKVAGHCSHIVGDDDPAEHRTKLQNLRVFHPFGDHVLRPFEIDLWLSQQKTSHDLLIEIGVGEKAALQAFLGTACSLASRSRADRASGNSVSIVFTSAQSRSWSFRYASTLSLFSR